MNKKVQMSDFQLLDRIGDIITGARLQTARTVNTILVKTYWEIGREIVEHELGGKFRAKYGMELLKTLSKELTMRYGRGFSQKNLENMRRFYLNYRISQTLSTKSKGKQIGSSESSLSQKGITNITAAQSANEILSQLL